MRENYFYGQEINSVFQRFAPAEGEADKIFVGGYNRPALAGVLKRNNLFKGEIRSEERRVGKEC